MREHIIPYVIDEVNRWWTGINITNHSYNSTSVLLDYYLPTGAKLKSEEITIPMMGMKTYMIDVYYRAWIRVISDDNVSIIIFTGTRNPETNENSFFAPIAIPIEKRNVIIKNVCNLSPGVVKIHGTKFVRDCSQTNNFLTNGIWDAVQLTGRWMHYQYPNRRAQQLEINDASTEEGVAEGHPLGSHEKGLDVDFCYYTLGKTNHTQGSSSCADELIPIDGDLFDAERNVDLIRTLKSIFPDSKLKSYAGFKEKLQAAAWKMYGDEVAKKFGQNSFIQYDTSKGYNHHTHLHVGTEKVNGEFSFGMH